MVLIIGIISKILTSVFIFVILSLLLTFINKYLFNCFLFYMGYMGFSLIKMGEIMSFFYEPLITFYFFIILLSCVVVDADVGTYGSMSWPFYFLMFSNSMLFCVFVKFLMKCISGPDFTNSFTGTCAENGLSIVFYFCSTMGFMNDFYFWVSESLMGVSNYAFGSFMCSWFMLTVIFKFFLYLLLLTANPYIWSITCSLFYVELVYLWIFYKVYNSNGMFFGMDIPDFHVYYSFDFFDDEKGENGKK